MARIFSIIALAALSVCTFAVSIVERAAALARNIVPVLITAEPFSIMNDHPRSIFETRRAGMA